MVSCKVCCLFWAQGWGVLSISQHLRAKDGLVEGSMTICWLSISCRISPVPTRLNSPDGLPPVPRSVQTAAHRHPLEHRQRLPRPSGRICDALRSLRSVRQLNQAWQLPTSRPLHCWWTWMLSRPTATPSGQGTARLYPSRSALRVLHSGTLVHSPQLLAVVQACLALRLPICIQLICQLARKQDGRVPDRGYPPPCEGRPPGRAACCPPTSAEC